MELLASYGKQIVPGILPAEITVACHRGSQCSQRKPVAAKSRRDELLLLVLPNERQAVVGLNHLAQPTMPQCRVRKQRFQFRLQSTEHPIWILLLAGLSIDA